MTLRFICSPTSAALAALALGACTSPDGSSPVSLEQSVAVHHVVAVAAGGAAPRALATLPQSAGHVRAVRERTYADGFRQDVLLDGSAVRQVVNGITVLARTDARGVGAPTPLAKPTEGAIRAELATQFPDVTMDVVTRPSANTYGRYGLAGGRIGPDRRCLYAWQWIDDPLVLARVAVGFPVSLRVRLCRSGQTFDEMASAIDGLQLGRDAASVAVAGDPAGLVDAAPLLVDAPDALERRPPAPAHPARHHRRASARLAHRPADRAAAAGETLVPASRDTSGIGPGGARYLAPVSPAAVETSAIPRPVALSGDLPAQAYLGPTAGRAAGGRP